MPLLLMCGLPSSGKTARCATITSYLEDSGRKVVVICDSSVSPNFDKNEAYSNATVEKELRSQLQSTVQRKLSKTRVVIVDSLNYIKSFRYELYCLAKAAQTTFAVVYCEATPELVAEWNNDSVHAYSEAVLKSLIDRFEPPDSANRWDSPLFVVPPKSSQLPLEAIYQALFKSKPAKPNKSTLANPVAPTNVSYDIDKCTSEIINSFACHLKSECLGDVMTVNMASSNVVKLRCKNETGLTHPAVSDADLQRHRRDFIALFRSKTHLQGSSEAVNVPQLFAAFLESRLFPGLDRTVDGL